MPDPKNSEPYNIALTPPAVRILAERKRRAARLLAEGKLSDGASPWVFPSASSRSGHIEDLKKGWTTLRKKAKIPDVRLHDLRRTLGSWQAALGSGLPVIAKSLEGHTAGGGIFTLIYSQLNLDPVRSSVNGAVQAMLTAGRKRR